MLCKDRLFHAHVQLAWPRGIETFLFPSFNKVFLLSFTCLISEMSDNFQFVRQWLHG